MQLQVRVLLGIARREEEAIRHARTLPYIKATWVRLAKSNKPWILEYLLADKSRILVREGEAFLAPDRFGRHVVVMPRRADCEMSKCKSSQQTDTLLWFWLIWQWKRQLGVIGRRPLSTGPPQYWPDTGWYRYRYKRFLTQFPWRYTHEWIIVILIISEFG